MITTDFAELRSSGFKPFGSERMVWKKGTALIVAHHTIRCIYEIGLVRRDSKSYNSHAHPGRELPSDMHSVLDVLDFAEGYRDVRRANLKMLEKEAAENYDSFWPANAAA